MLLVDRLRVGTHMHTYITHIQTYTYIHTHMGWMTQHARGEEPQSSQASMSAPLSRQKRTGGVSR